MTRKKIDIDKSLLLVTSFVLSGDKRSDCLESTNDILVNSWYKRVLLIFIG